jgi:hypothetical protein
VSHRQTGSSINHGGPQPHPVTTRSSCGSAHATKFIQDADWSLEDEDNRDDIDIAADQLILPIL